MKRIFVISLFAATCASFQSCSKTEDATAALIPLGGQPSPQTQDFNNQVSGPALDGTWLSGCVGDFGASKIIAVTVSGQTTTRQTQFYKDANCQTIDHQVNSSGKFRYNSQVKDGVYQVEYRFDFNGGYQTTYENVRLDASGLWVSDFRIGDVDPTVLLKGTGPAPAPTPPTPGACPSLSGNWNMNGVSLEIAQKGCSEVDWIHEGETDVYLTDNVARAVAGTMVKSYYQAANWVLEYQDDDGASMRTEYSLQKVPCNLANPDGSDYLTRNTYRDGQFYRCSFFAHD